MRITPYRKQLGWLRSEARQKYFALRLKEPPILLPFFNPFRSTRPAREAPAKILKFHYHHPAPFRQGSRTSETPYLHTSPTSRLTRALKEGFVVTWCWTWMLQAILIAALTLTLNLTYSNLLRTIISITENYWVQLYLSISWRETIRLLYQESFSIACELNVIIYTRREKPNTNYWAHYYSKNRPK